MANPVSRLLNNLNSRVIGPDDSEEQKLHKTLLIFACGLIGFAAMLWLAIYHAMGIKYSATVPLIYLAVSATTLGIYVWNLNFDFFRFAQTSLYLFVPFILFYFWAARYERHPEEHGFFGRALAAQEA